MLRAFGQRLGSLRCNCKLQANSNRKLQCSRSSWPKPSKNLNSQRKVISSSENFVREVFSSHMFEQFEFDMKQPVTARSGFLPRSSGSKGKAVVFLLLAATPLPKTLQLQYHVLHSRRILTVQSTTLSYSSGTIRGDQIQIFTATSG